MDSPPAGWDRDEQDGDTPGRSGRLRASWAPGHAIDSGLSTALPDWLFRIRPGRLRGERVARRGKPHGPGIRVDWRRTVRRWQRHGFADAALIWTLKPGAPRRVVVLWDVSGSMTAYWDWYLPWIHRLVNQRPDVFVFAFGTELAELTEYLKRPYADAVKALYDATALWGSGTAMGESFQRWIAQDGTRLLGVASSVLVISDGWDVGSPALLEAALRHMAQRAREVLWVNPLMATEGFEPRTRALRVAQQYTGQMLSGASPEELRRLAWHLGLVA